MAARTYAAILNGDGTATFTPTPLVIVPGATCVISTQVFVNNSGVVQPLDLTNLTLDLALLDGTGMIVIFQTGSPCFTVTAPTVGLVTITLTNTLTTLLAAGSYTLELKSVNPNDGTRLQLCYTAITVTTTALAAL